MSLNYLSLECLAGSICDTIRMRLFRGWIGEKKTTFRMWLTLDGNTYRKFHNVIVPGKSGTTQIDHLIVSVYGLFIVETKNKTGWIFGSENQANWTQTLYREKYTFQNPLRQTYRQKKVLSEYLNINESIIQTIVYFVGNCSFKTHMPPNVMKSGLSRYIKYFRNRILSDEDMGRIMLKLERLVSESAFTNRDHVRSLRIRHTSNTVCPRCGSILVERTAKKGPNAGSNFLGCSNYPKCRFTKNV